MRLPLAQGLHVGEVEVEGAGVTGLVAHVAERIAAGARPGEILAAALVAELAAGSGLHFDERGPLAIDGLERPVRLVALVTEQHLEPAAARIAGRARPRPAQRPRAGGAGARR